ncbi:MAG: Fic family protein [Candidatus Glassbacteria bacterium]|nr:Fic family protein [Candidatus Glassbacteria bacterium]
MKSFQPAYLPLKDLNWLPLIKLIGKANAEIARYDGIIQGIVNTDILLSPLQTQEAVLSSKIEGTQATFEEVLEYEADPERVQDKKEDINEVLNYRVAMQDAVRSLRTKPLSLNLIKRIHSALLQNVRGHYKARGKLRTIQNWIGNPGCKIEDASYVPPEPQAVLPLMDNLEKYIHQDEMDALVQLAILHAQFELIHPFLDGNGRAGRILIPLFLFQKSILSTPMFYLSYYLEANRKEYYFRLQNISRERDWEGWIAFFLGAIIEQAHENKNKAMQIVGLYNDMKDRISQATRSQFAIQTLDALFERPIFQTTGFAIRSQIQKQSALRILNALKKEKILVTVRESRGRQAEILMFKDLIELVQM